MNTLNTIILFTRYPRPGHCKTRMLPQYSSQEAADIHRQLVAHTITAIEGFLATKQQTAYHIFYTDASAKEMEKWLGPRHFIAQEGRDLGERMAHALTLTLQNTKNCILLGSDCPEVTPQLLEEAFSALQAKDIVLGPAFDGGYYLIGANNSCTAIQLQALFTNIPWGSGTVLSKTLAKIEALSLQAHLLKKLHDIDTPDDLHYFNYYSDLK